MRGQEQRDRRNMCVFAFFKGCATSDLDQILSETLDHGVGFTIFQAAVDLQAI